MSVMILNHYVVPQLGCLHAERQCAVLAGINGLDIRGAFLCEVALPIDRCIGCGKPIMPRRNQWIVV